MKQSPYSPDGFMSGLYGRIKAEPYKNAETYEDALEISKSIKEKARELFSLDKLSSMETELKLIPVGKDLDYPKYTLKKYSVEILEGLNSLVYILEPKNPTKKTNGVVALCGHGYGVRQILGISKSAAYNIMRQLNDELKEKGYAVSRGKISRKYFEERFYGMTEAV